MSDQSVDAVMRYAPTFAAHPANGSTKPNFVRARPVSPVVVTIAAILPRRGICDVRSLGPSTRIAFDPQRCVVRLRFRFSGCALPDHPDPVMSGRAQFVQAPQLLDRGGDVGEIALERRLYRRLGGVVGQVAQQVQAAGGYPG